MTQPVLSKRLFLTGLLATPAIVAISHLMPLRGIKFNPVVRVQSWPTGTEHCGEYWLHEGPLSRIGPIEQEMNRLFGACYYSSASNSTEEISKLGITATINYEDRTVEDRAAVTKLVQDNAVANVRYYKGGHVWLNRDPEEQIRYIDKYNVYHDRRIADLRDQLNRICKWGV